MIDRILKTSKKLKKLTPYMHRIAVIYFIYTLLRDHRAKKKEKAAAKAA